MRAVEGICRKRAQKITAGWADQNVIREIMVFLHQHGVGTARSVRMFKTYGTDAVQVMSENPYRLAKDIRGTGFRTADTIAEKLGFEKSRNDPNPGRDFLRTDRGNGRRPLRSAAGRPGDRHCIGKPVSLCFTASGRTRASPRVEFC